MDSLRAVVGRLIFGIVVALVAPSMAVAQTSCPAANAALQACLSSAASLNSNPSYASQAPFYCKYNANYGGHPAYVQYNNAGAVFGGYQFTACAGWSPSGNPCASLAPVSVNMSFSGSQTLGKSGATWATDQTTGAQVQCPFTISYSNTSALSDSNGFFHVQATMTYSGNPAGSESSTPTAGTSVYNDSSGNPLSAQPTSDGSSSPQLCGGTSCADPSTGNVCSVVGGAQTCTKFPPWTPNMAGACSGGSSSAICAGSPTAPIPQPGQGGVSDPSTQIAGSDKYTSMNMNTGQVGSTVVNVFSGKSGQTVSNGAGAGSKGAANSSGNPNPASSSSTSGTGYGSGGDCNSPPVCSGDAVMCGIGRQEWYAMCSAKAGTDQLHKDLAGDGNGPPTYAADQTKYSQSSVWVPPNTGDTQGDAANAGTYNQGGFGYSRQCPLQDIQFTSIPFVAKFSAGCSVIEYFGDFLLGLALFAAACITAGSNQ